jgi:membrane protein YqaA with SNARE-associated domain
VGDIVAALAPYLGLFVTAFLAATVLPAQSELLFTAMTLSGRFDPAWLVVAATAGNTLGSVVNWMMGRFVTQFSGRRWFPFDAAAIEKAEAFYARWGKWSLLLSWTPVIGDVLTFSAGVMRMPVVPFVCLVTTAKGGRYLALLAAIHAIAW